MRAKWLVLAAALLVAVMAASAGTAVAAQYQWKIGHIRPTGTEIDRDVNWLVEKIKEESGGRIVIDIFPASQLGDYTVVQERVSMGAIEMQLACLGTTVSKALNLPAAPYLATNYEQAEKLFSPGGVVYEIVGEILAAKENIHLISGWPVYFGGIGLLKQAPSPGDPNVPKNIKIRVPPIKSFELTAEALGYIATPIPWAETFTAMQTGIVDGVIGGGAEGYYANFRDLLKEYHAVNDHFEMWFWYMNKDLWNKLSKEDQDLLTKLGRELEAKRWKEAPDAERANEQRLASVGINILHFSQEELDAMVEKAKEIVWPGIRGDIGEEYFDRVMKVLQ
jgi:TRAP-type C4-dicarboxylate transport system substrate-binding protein